MSQEGIFADTVSITHGVFLIGKANIDFICGYCSLLIAQYK